MKQMRGDSIDHIEFEAWVKVQVKAQVKDVYRDAFLLECVKVPDMAWVKAI